ncbi:CU044_5270 family protein [Spirillospora albida]|uniref:CU044_5270 family protein n=1 Tax=Spirillospora albida TaxID=58123 RepID=UPI0004BF1B28|nr:CU044_5270 family protein [Spirillospora albida]
MSDILRTLREARPEELAPDLPVAEDVRRAELAHAMASRPVGGRARARRSVRPVWGLGAVGLAGAVAAALVAVNVPADGEPGAPAAQPATARTVLLAAAGKADGRPDGTGAFWHVATVSSMAHQVSTGGVRYTVVDRQRHETWTPGRPGAKIRADVQNLGARPATAKDEAAWRRAGAPARFEIRVPIGPNSTVTKTFVTSVKQGPVRRGTSPRPGDGKLFWLGRNVGVKELRALPADPARLRAGLLRWYDGRDTESGAPMSRDAWLYRVASGLVTDMPVAPKVRAAAFRMLADLPRVRSLGRVTDAQGRTGLGVGLDEKTRAGLVLHRLVIDPATGGALAGERVLVRPAAGEGRAPGTVLGSTAVLTAAWTDAVR